MMKEQIRKCSYPTCKSLCTSRGRNTETGKPKRAAWCQSHIKGKLKEERIEYTKKHPLGTQNQKKGTKKSGGKMVGMPRLERMSVRSFGKHLDKNK